MEKVKLIEDTLVEGLFGHIVIGNVFWSQLGQYLEQYFERDADTISSKIDQVLLHHPLNKFPVSSPHLTNVLLWLKDCYSQHGKKLSPEIRARLEMVQTQAEPTFIYKTLNRNPGLNPSGGVVTLLEENDIIGHGTTGLTSWQGALFLTDWLLANGQALVQDKRVLELGCGPGLHLLSNLAIESYTFTDGHPEVLKAVAFNLKLNNGALDTLKYEEFEAFATRGYPDIATEVRNEIWSKTKNSSQVFVAKLDWLEPPIYELDPCFQGIEVILGADIVYERSLIPPLCRVLNCLLKQQNGCKALISCTERSATTLNCFETNLSEQNLHFSVIGRGFFTPAESLLCSDVLHQATRIYEIKS